MIEARRLLAPRPIGGAVIALVMGTLGFVSELFAGPGYEQALASGLLCPSVAAIVTALELSREPRAPLWMLGRGVENGALMALTAFVVSLVHGVIAGFCDLAAGTMLFALGPGVGAILGGVWGAIVSEAALGAKRRRLRASVGGLGGPLGSALFQLALFYGTPMVFAFDPFAGYFSGALYDTVLAYDELASYRVASAATLFAVYALAVNLERRDGKLALKRALQTGLLAIGAISAAGSAASVIEGDELGQWQTKGTIAKHLGGKLQNGRCLVLYDVDMDRTHVERFARDCNAHIDDVAAWLDIDVSAPVTAYLFADRGQKRYYMGAGRVSVAKPWRREIYLHNQDYPHRVVRHELVHALSSDIGTGPFSVAGGILPNPGLVEGLAEAAAPRDDNLSGHEWAAAMRAIDVLPTTDQLFGLAFFGQASSASYTAAGSFLSHVREAFGPQAIKRWYGGEDITDITGKTMAELEASWHQRLDTITLSDAARITAELRFDRPGVFDRRCPHEVDALLGEGLGLIGNDNAGATAVLDRVLALDPGNIRALMGQAACHVSSGDTDVAHAAYDGIASHPSASKLDKLTALERRGDLELRHGRGAAALALYAPLVESITDEGRRRTLDLKMHYAEHPLGRAALVALLIGTDERGTDNVEALDRIGQWRAAMPDDGTPLYLLGRQHFNRKRYNLAIERFEQALSVSMPVPRAVSETLRLQTIAACAAGRHDEARKALAAYVGHPLVTRSRAHILEALAARCTRAAP